jgi:hypothetical protein
MSLSSLNAKEKEIVRRAMAATFDYFTVDFVSRIGIEPEEMRNLLNTWPELGIPGRISAISTTHLRPAWRSTIL